MQGVIVVDKPKDYTSRDVVNIIGKIYKTKKVGHTGTLDPLATGVMIVCVNRATKIVDLLTSYDKEYIATFKFGVLTDTLDITGNILKDEKIAIKKEDIQEAISKMIGKYMQEVPLYSAVRINGKKLYEYARENIEVSLPLHEVNIQNLELTDYQIIDGYTVIKVKCNVSKGTYIRSLGNDIASLLNTNAIMTDLRRTKQGNFDISSAKKLEEINIDTNLISIKDCLSKYKTVVASQSLEEDILNGKLLENIYNEENVLFIDSLDNAIALYTIYEKDNTKLKPFKMFKTRL